VSSTTWRLQGFGGVLPVAQRVLVEQQRWLSREQFVETLSLGQVLPGPNIVNMALMIGDRFFGLRGALAALGGLLTAPLLIVLALAALYGQLSSVPAVAGALRGMGAVSAGLIVATALKVMPTLRKSRWACRRQHCSWPPPHWPSAGGACRWCRWCWAWAPCRWRWPPGGCK
jgi:chromate transporter